MLSPQSQNRLRWKKRPLSYKHMDTDPRVTLLFQNIIFNVGVRDLHAFGCLLTVVEGTACGYEAYAWTQTHGRPVQLSYQPPFVWTHRFFLIQAPVWIPSLICAAFIASLICAASIASPCVAADPQSLLCWAVLFLVSTADSPGVPCHLAS